MWVQVRLPEHGFRVGSLLDMRWCIWFHDICSHGSCPVQCSSLQAVPVAKARVLHFESCTYEAWRDKFLRHTHHCEGKKKNDIPFVFYRDSITLLQDDTTGGEDGAEERWRAFYHERKIDHYASLKDNQKLRLTLRPDTPAMINAASTGPTEEEAKDRAMLEELD